MASSQSMGAEECSVTGPASRHTQGAALGAAQSAGTLLLTLVMILGSVRALHAIPVDPNVDFAAHVAHRGLVVDEMPGASPALLVPAGRQSWGGGPRFLLQARDQTIAALWFPQAGQMIVRQTVDPHSPLIGEIDAAWSQGAIHLTFKPADGRTLQTGTFDRIDGRIATAALSSQAQTVLDVRGVYRADVRDADGKPVGWLRVQISSHQPAERIYDGVLPPALNGSLAAAAVAVLDADVSEIERHAADVYVGN
jgi:hypothetical protein